MNLPAGLLTLLREPSTCYFATSMPDGSPQITQTWGGHRHGKHILINTVEGFQKVRNIDRDPRVAVSVSDPAEPSRYSTRSADASPSTPPPTAPLSTSTSWRTDTSG